ncbi:MAG: hypothetical protein AVDCRST_MAG59-2659 [uncultured Thermomicrobiales bacterium]|uniref:Uncharacterized protein n=1 Tax=uncultured Thermomicrobiales bacterium TaxID=1645740 RepID=A0A6J4V0H8_9BACT|nr:MAG: hypothetical protein AVDCRST_MAG59-2659 [uncultured Thermomicrobiales bacterium]
MAREQRDDGPRAWVIGIAAQAALVVAATAFDRILAGAGDDAGFARVEAWIMALGSTAGFLSALAALVVGWLTRRSVETAEAVLREAREGRLAEFRPVVLVTFERRADDLVLVVAHYRGNPALNVRFAFSPPLVNEMGKDVGAEPPFSIGIPVVVPSYRQAVRFGSFEEYRAHWHYGVERDNTETVTGRFEATVTLTDPQAQDREQAQTFVLDANPLFEFTRSFWRPAPPRPIASWRERGPLPPKSCPRRSGRSALGTETRRRSPPPAPGGRWRSDAARQARGQPVPNTPLSAMTQADRRLLLPRPSRPATPRPSPPKGLTPPRPAPSGVPARRRPGTGLAAAVRLPPGRDRAVVPLVRTRLAPAGRTDRYGLRAGAWPPGSEAGHVPGRRCERRGWGG